MCSNDLCYTLRYNESVNAINPESLLGNCTNFGSWSCIHAFRVHFLGYLVRRVSGTSITPASRVVP